MKIKNNLMFLKLLQSMRTGPDFRQGCGAEALVLGYIRADNDFHYLLVVFILPYFYEDLVF